jgi:phospholipid/cholesterol/gamma-HCH transport system substrate-binding protein
MGSTREKALVGLFVLVAGVVLFGAAMVLTGGVGTSRVPHRTYFKFSGGLEAGATVRYGGLNVGKVKRVHVDPRDSTRIEVEFAVDPDTPIKVDSIARVTSLGLLSDNYLEVSPGGQNAGRAPSGSIVKSKEPFGVEQIGDAVQALLPDVQKTLKILNTDLDGLQTTISQANDVLNEKNRANISATLSTMNVTLAELRPQLNKTFKQVDDMLTDVQPKISGTLTDVQALTKKMDPLLDHLDTTIKTANDTLANVDGTLNENRADIRASVESLRQVLEKSTALVGQLNAALNQNTGNVDETLDNVRLTTENLRQLTETLKTSPTSVFRGTGVKDRKPGGSRE